MPLVLPKRCPNCATKIPAKDADGYWTCPSCGWTDRPALSPDPMPVSPEGGAVVDGAASAATDDPSTG